MFSSMVCVSAGLSLNPDLKENSTAMALLNQTPMWAVSILLSLVLSKGKLRDYGFTIGSFRFKSSILLWAFAGTLSCLLGIFIGGAVESPAGEMNYFQMMLLVWIYASVSEEIMYRGLLQSFLSPLSHRGIRVSGIFLSLPVMFSALLFGAAHLFLLTMGMALSSVLIIVFSALLIGLVAGYYRERTGSLVPAVIVHALFNIGGSLPFWVSELF